ncbi:MAG: alpha/beta hydrolase [Sphingomonadales bacterium]|nr:alpha/beta hydrolase [Sphingomonadales bacterium]
MTDYVLVHGAWGGGWTLEGLADDLKAHGHRVLVAALTGLGVRAAELSPAITLSDHVADVIDQVQAAGFDRFVLVGHSYGGMVITGVATHLGSRIDAIAYIDAFLPGDGQSLWDMTGDQDHQFYIDGQRDMPGLVAPLPFLPPEPRLGRHPEPVRFTGEEAKIARRAYVFAANWSPTPFNRFYDLVKDDPAWEVHRAEASHDVMTDQPEQLCELLLDLGRPSS